MNKDEMTVKKTSYILSICKASRHYEFCYDFSFYFDQNFYHTKNKQQFVLLCGLSCVSSSLLTEERFRNKLSTHKFSFSKDHIKESCCCGFSGVFKGNPTQ